MSIGNERTREFRAESIAWTESLGYGYSLYATRSDDRYYTLVFTSEWKDMPTIECTYDMELDESHCKLTNGMCMPFLQMASSRLAFRHSEIKRFIAAFKYYAYLARTYKLDVQMIDELVKSLDDNKQKQ